MMVLHRRHDHMGGAAPKSIFAYATRLDLTVMGISCLAAIIAGALNPFLTVIYGRLVGAFRNSSDQTISEGELQAAISTFSLFFVYLAIAEFVFVYISIVGFYHAGERIVQRLRRAYLAAIIRQNIAFFDNLGAGEVTDRLTTDMNIIQDGITNKLSITLTAVATLLSSFVIGFVEYWKLGLILLSVLVAMTLTGSMGARFAANFKKRSRLSESLAIAVAEQTISSIRHVVAYSIQRLLADRYFGHVLEAEQQSFKAAIVVSIVIGILHSIPYFAFGLTFWQGAQYVIDGAMSAEAVVTTALAIVIGAFAIGKVTPNAQAYITSLASADEILKAIARRSLIDPFSEAGARYSNVRGEIVFKGVRLIYPSRSNTTVLENFDITFPAGKTTAIVGHSGCGKSSILSLVERFYDPVSGDIELDGHNIRSLHLGWLRNQMAYVSQETILFNTTIFDNIACGLRQCDSVSNSELLSLVMAAAQNANAHDFIVSLPDGYNSRVGERGMHLSGGQRQRIAFARAIISRPKILLLDEPTAALDTVSERIVQKALESIAGAQTTLVVSHRLSTIRQADNIVMMSAGKIVDQGNHDTLMKHDGLYRRMVELQLHLPSEGGSLLKRVVSDEENINEKLTAEPDKAELLNFQPSGPDPLSIASADSSEAVSQGLSSWALTRLAFRLTKSEIWFTCTGLLAAAVHGLGNPVQSVFFAKLIVALSLPPTFYNQLQQERNFWSLMFLMLALVALIARTVECICFSFVSEKLTVRARDQSMRAILQKDVAFFDKPQNSTGALINFLSAGTTNLNSLNGAIIGSILAFMATIVGGMALSLAIGWKLALVCTATVPFVAGTGWGRLRVLNILEEKIKHTQEESAAYASDSVVNVRSIASLSMETKVLDRYYSIIARQASNSLSSILQASALYAASQSVNFLCAALAFWYGGTLIASGEYSMFQFFICFSALISGSQSAGGIFAFAPDISKATRAGRELQCLLDDQRGSHLSTRRRGAPEKPEEAPLELKNTSFAYPSRPGKSILHNVNMNVRPGQFIGVVGPSGSGKSTIISLIERFYDPTEGCLRLGDDDICDIDLIEYRKILSFVSQDTVVYQGTIRENIVLGLEGEVSDEAVIEVCREANILDFILSLPEAFSTVVGMWGTMLSGGQKQRIAIARALLRSPKILLLDEATSALDSESEKIIQEALDAARAQRTVIALAHRLSTVRKADCIYVLDHGRIVEKGNHDDLMNLRQTYYSMIHA